MITQVLLILTGILTILLLVITFVMLSKLSALKKEVHENRKENMNFNRQEYEALGRTLSDFSERQENQFNGMRNSLGEVYKTFGQMQRLSEDVWDLKKILSNVKTRGILGEIQLGSILSQILAPGQYEENVSVIPESADRVEFAVKMPGAEGEFIYLPIDAKFPADAYSNLLDAYDSENTERIIEARKQLHAALRRAAKDISEKYIESPYTTDFGVMFLPFEGLYAEAVNLGEMEALQSDFKVILAGPSTMAALLNSLQMGFKTLEIQKNTSEVWHTLENVKSEFDKFAEVLEETQFRMGQASDSLDKLIGTRTRSIQRSLRNIESKKDI